MKSYATHFIIIAEHTRGVLGHKEFKGLAIEVFYTLHKIKAFLPKAEPMTNRTMRMV